MGCSLQQDEEEIYDYVVCGGGTAGCVLAARLAEDPNVSILILEAGKSNKDVPASSMPGGLPFIVGSEDEWNIKSKPTSGLDNRSIDLIRGKFLGGSSGCNGALAIRGSREDYDQWDLPGWSGNEVFGYMNKAENFHPTSWLIPDKSAHGNTGHLHTAPHEPCLLSTLILQAYQEKGFPLIPDVFSTGESPHACGHALRTIYQGIRSTGADFVTKDDETKNLRIRTNVFVDTIILEQRGDRRKKATGVVLQGLEGAKIEVKARREVLLCGGSYGSPAVLLRSGIGPKEEVQAVGVDSKVDLKGVGKNLMDHPLALIFYEVAKPGLTTDHLIWHDGAQDRSMAEYQAQKTGFFSQFPFGTFAFARLDDRLYDSDTYCKASQAQQETNGRDAMHLHSTQPHVELWNTECYGPHSYADAPSNDKHAFAMIVTLFSAQSRGTVTIATKDPKASPVVDHRHLEDSRDSVVLAEGCRLANEIVTQSTTMEGLLVGGWPKGAVHHEWTTRKDWEAYVYSNANTCYHPAGTCKMGNDGDDAAVLDAELTVRGVDGLRVVDASVMPLLMGGHPQMAVYAIAEKAADMIKMGAKAKR